MYSCSVRSRSKKSVKSTKGREKLPRQFEPDFRAALLTGIHRDRAWRASLLALGAVVFAAVAGCFGDSSGGTPAADPESKAAVALVGEEPITVERFHGEMLRRGGQRPGQYATTEQKRALLDEMVRFEALAAQARAAGYDRDPETLEVLKRLMVARYQRDALEARLAGLEVSDEEIERFYAENEDEFARPERSRAAIVFIEVPKGASKTVREQREQRARAALAEAHTLDPEVAHFGSVAIRYSDDRASRYRGGVIGWLSRGSSQRYKWGDEVVQAVLALERPGELGPLVQTDAGYYLVRLVDREQSAVRPLGALRDGLRNRLLHEKQAAMREAFEREALAGHSVEVDEALLAAIEAPTPPTNGEAMLRPPSLPRD